MRRELIPAVVMGLVLMLAGVVLAVGTLSLHWFGHGPAHPTASPAPTTVTTLPAPATTATPTTTIPATTAPTTTAPTTALTTVAPAPPTTGLAMTGAASQAAIVVAIVFVTAGLGLLWLSRPPLQHAPSRRTTIGRAHGRKHRCR